ncbi:MAG: glycosyltransferase family 4 protein [Candidatus Omnitrophica bacterium]|nr:glycosyltransferase family 4 protein [Candidatus Omnitrophota bacterium]
MRVFWFNNILFPEAAQSLGLPPPVSGGWMPALGHALNETGKVQLAVATVVKKPLWSKKEIDGIMHYTIPFPQGGRKEIDLRPGKKLLGDCLKAIEDFAPDVVHIHGTEYFYGLLSAKSLIKCPAIVSTQGLIKEYAKVYWGELSFKEVLKCQSLYEFIIRCGSGLLLDRRRWHKRAKYMEQKIIKGNRYFIGRTLWDKAHLLEINPTADYYHCDELLRPPFYSIHWEPNHMAKYSIFAASARYPIKGFHLLLKAAAMLKRDFPEMSIRVADGLIGRRPRRKTYNTLLYDLIDSSGLKDCVVPLGLLSAEEMAKEMSKAHAVVIPSFIENSSNSLAEAMLVGAPCVASLAGGTTTMIDDRQTALGFPAGDAAMLAECLRMIFSDDKLANNLSKSAKATAQKRHDKKIIVKTMLQIYEDVIKKGR